MNVPYQTIGRLTHWRSSRWWYDLSYTKGATIEMLLSVQSEMNWQQIEHIIYQTETDLCALEVADDDDDIIWVIQKDY